MKKLFAMLLALCLMCGVVSAGAEATQTISATLAEFNIPTEWELLVSMDDGSMFWGTYCPTDASWIEIVICSTWAVANFDQCTSQIDCCASMAGMFWVVDGENVTISEGFSGEMPDGEPLAIGNISDRETFLCHRYSDIVMGIRIFNCTDLYPTLESILDVTLPIFTSVTNPAIEANRKTVVNESTAVAEETKSETWFLEDKQEIMLGNVHFQVPAELTAQEPNNGMGLYLQQFVGADYVVEILVFDYEEADVPLQILKGADDQINNLFWCYRVFSALIGEDEDDTALSLCNNASRCEIEPYGQELLYYGAGGLGLAAHYYRNMGCLVMVLSRDESIDDDRCCEIALSIAGSFRIDGVTEEQMAADAEAARIAAEEAAARAAAQKYIVIKNGTANIRTGPSSDYDRITTAKQGDVFPLMGEEGTWYMIEVNGQTAYVSKGLCEIKE